MFTHGKLSKSIGVLFKQCRKEKIAQLAARYQCYVIEDDIYGECSFSSSRPLPIKYWDQQGYDFLWFGFQVTFNCVSGRLVLYSAALSAFEGYVADAKYHSEYAFAVGTGRSHL